MNHDAFLDALLTAGSAVTVTDAVCVAIILRDAPILLAGCVVSIGDRSLEYSTPEHALAALFAAQLARTLAP